MSYDTQQYYNSALAIVAGAGAAAVAFRLLPPLPPAFRSRRLLVRTLRNLRRLSAGRLRCTPADWESRIYSSLAVMPEHADLLDFARLVALSPVNGYVTNLLAQVGDFATVGQATISVVDADSFWVDGYFEETSLWAIREGDPASVKLMGYRQVVLGHVGSVARGINVANAQQGQAGLASVNPIFTWVRLAQRVPVRIDIDHVPDGVRLVQGMTATVEVDRHGEP